TVRPEVAAVTLTADDVTTAVFESVTRAVRDTAPAAVGVHWTDAGDVGEPGTKPTRVAPAKNSICEMVARPTALKLAVSVTGLPTLTVEPAVGAISATVGAVTLTLTIDDVTALWFESVTFAVSEMIPDAPGVQLKL